MPALFENIFNKMVSEYKMNSEMLREYADKGCQLTHNKSLTDFVEINAAIFESDENAEDFLVAVISLGMADTLHNVMKDSPFKRIQYKKPSTLE